MGPDGLPLSLYLASVEWRRGKRPQGGYPHYAANVKFVTGSRYEATRKLNELTKSNKPAPQTKRISVPPKKYGEESDDTDTEVPQQTDKPTSSPSSTVSTQSSSPSASSQSSKMAIDAGSGDMDTTSSSPSKVEIFKGSGVMVDKLAWAYAVNANSCTTFVRQLLTAVFPPEVLLVSNLRGTNKGKGEARLPLEKTKVDAIYNATLERWPGTPLSLIGSSINGKITEMRNKVKQQK
ncbi:uncharacterized protein LOC121712067 isoform X3 [Alosa sapidissima]|uniref:uncharacterized protein LOC121694209 isoform X3 n=1 Tax=Alosa sapidissima TaxID=34773 RepID=UPI001C09DE84|nr:uncharacterized protein LOC121694209 isoform X3 [Alosa sapidissima]XP_041951976.1 uncharacterized protein LOC121712067 isoform X3 [Alosa sapidissima]